jgi:hypothetical protein
MEELKKLYEETELPITEILIKAGIGQRFFRWWVDNNYSKEYQSARKRKSYSNSKLGSKNPMLGKTASDHPRFVGEVEDGKGYLMAIKPEWYTGREGSHHVFVHHLVMCEAIGLTEIPKGFCVHHVDNDPKNNEISNLALLSMEAHTKLHQLEKRFV